MPSKRKERIRSDKTQRRLREMIEIVNKLEPRFGSALIAFAWYRSEPRAGFSGQTAMQLVKAGRADEVMEFIDAVDAGIHAQTFVDFDGHLYRGLNPIYPRAPLSAACAQLYGGRFNPKGMAALYASLSIHTAIREANQAGSLQPTMLVSYRPQISNIFDSRDPSALAGYEMTASTLVDDSWRDQMRVRGKSASQEFAERLVAGGYNGLLVQSYAPGSRTGGLKLVLWQWGEGTSVQLALIEDEGRLACSGSALPRSPRRSVVKLAHDHLLVGPQRLEPPRHLQREAG